MFKWLTVLVRIVLAWLLKLWEFLVIFKATRQSLSPPKKTSPFSCQFFLPKKRTHLKTNNANTTFPPLPCKISPAVLAPNWKPPPPTSVLPRPPKIVAKVLPWPQRRSRRSRLRWWHEAPRDVGVRDSAWQWFLWRFVFWA